MRVLYISDLDGTLLHSDETISENSARIINDFVHRGGLFSFATARSLVTSQQVTQGIDANIPVIVYNGTFVMDYKTKNIMIANYFDSSIQNVINDLISHEVYPIVYSYIDGKEYFSFIGNQVSQGMQRFLNTRLGDVRWREVKSVEALIQGNLFYITCIDASEKLYPLYQKYKQNYHCIYDKDLYSKEQWLEFMPKLASKANAVLQLKAYLNCDKVIAFGDGKNDMDLFKIADECYAVSNANEELKKMATGIIGSYNEDSVAKFISQKGISERGC